LKSLFEITKAERKAWNKNRNDLERIRTALAKEAKYHNAIGEERTLSKSKIKNLLRRVRVDSPLLETWNKTSKCLE